MSVARWPVLVGDVGRWLYGNGVEENFNSTRKLKGSVTDRFCKQCIAWPLVWASEVGAKPCAR